MHTILDILYSASSKFLIGVLGQISVCLKKKKDKAGDQIDARVTVGFFPSRYGKLPSEGRGTTKRGEYTKGKYSLLTCEIKSCKEEGYNKQHGM